LTWRRHAAGRMAHMVRWLMRCRLEWMLSHHRRTGDSLSAQIVNDVQALAYIRRRQFLACAKLKELRR
jgi:hypothetical protein